MIWPFSIFTNKTNKAEREISILKEQIALVNSKLNIVSESVTKAGINIKESQPLNERSKKSFTDIASDIKKAISLVNEESFKKVETEISTQYAIEDLDVELKGGVSMEGSTLQFTQLNSSELSPESVSTIKFKVKPIIKTKISE